MDLYPVYKIRYLEAVPTFPDSNPSNVETGRVSGEQIVVLDCHDSQKAVDAVKEMILKKRDALCSSDAPINTVKGFQLLEVILITNAHHIVSKSRA